LKVVGDRDINGELGDSNSLKVKKIKSVKVESNKETEKL
jgi:hypothetical protein